jgi:hypothetical protein
LAGPFLRSRWYHDDVRHRLIRRHAIVAGLALMPVSCTNSQAPQSQVEERRIAPATANVAVTQWLHDHYVWVAPRTESSQIVLLLPGTNGRPSNARLIGAIAAEQGYRAIGLMYPDNVAVVSACAYDGNQECMALVRAEIIEGIDHSPHVSVDPVNSIDGRLADLIRYLAIEYPGENWQNFLSTDGTPRWDRIAVAGLSQGGGHAAYIAKLRSVPRVVMFGAPADGYSAQPAPWMQLGATPAERYFGFRHARDPFLSIRPNWLALGLDAFGAEKDVRASTTMFDGSHMLSTDLLPSTGSYGNAHPSVFADGVTPRRSNGAPVFETAWRYLLGTPPE